MGGDTMTGYLEVLGAVTIWAIINGVLVKGIKTSGVSVGTWMSFVGVLIFYAVNGGMNPVSGLTSYQLILLAFLGVSAALNNALFYTALKMTYVYNAALVHYFASVLVIPFIFFVPLFNEQLGIVDMAAILTGFVGLVVITIPNWSGSKRWLCFAFGSALFYSLEMLFGRSVSTHDVPAEVSAFVKLLAQTAIMPVVGLALRQPIRVDRKTEWLKIVLAGALLYMSFVLYFSGVRTVPVKHSAVLGYVDRIGAIALGAYFFKEKLTRSVWVGGALIMAAGLLTILFK